MNVSFGPVPKEYDYIYFNQVIHQLTLYIAKQATPQPIQVQRINITNLPTASAGLRTGDLWNDSGTVKIV